MSDYIKVRDLEANNIKIDNLEVTNFKFSTDETALTSTSELMGQPGTIQGMTYSDTPEQVTSNVDLICNKSLVVQCGTKTNNGVLDSTATLGDIKFTKRNEIDSDSGLYFQWTSSKNISLVNGGGFVYIGGISTNALGQVHIRLSNLSTDLETTDSAYEERVDDLLLPTVLSNTLDGSSIDHHSKVKDDNYKQYLNQYPSLYVEGKNGNGGLIVSTYFVVKSDSRIKKNITNINDNYALNMLRQIEPKYYEYIHRAGFTNKTMGFIAQEVKELLPEAVSISKGYIPDPFTLLEEGNFHYENNKLIINNFQKKDNDVGTYRFYFIDKYKKPVFKELEINEDNSFDVEEEYPKVFLWGRLVDDFHQLDKNKLYTIAFSALQEVDRQQQIDKGKIYDLKQEVAALKATQASILERLNKLEN